MELKHKPYNKFKVELKDKGIRYEDLAQLLGCTVSTVSKKINGAADFYLGEYRKLERDYGLGIHLF